MSNTFLLNFSNMTPVSQSHNSILLFCINLGSDSEWLCYFLPIHKHGRHERKWKKWTHFETFGQFLVWIRLKNSLEMSKSSEKALSLLRHMPRLTLRAVERMPEIRKKVIQRGPLKRSTVCQNEIDRWSYTLTLWGVIIWCIRFLLAPSK